MREGSGQHGADRNSFGCLRPRESRRAPSFSAAKLQHATKELAARNTPLENTANSLGRRLRCHLTPKPPPIAADATAAADPAGRCAAEASLASQPLFFFGWFVVRPSSTAAKAPPELPPVPPELASASLARHLSSHWLARQKACWQPTRVRTWSRPASLLRPPQIHCTSP